ncbi:MAG: DinB family protein [Planctomycetota bacterium]
MSLGTAMLPEFDHEMTNTRKVLECVPDNKLNWRATEKLNTIGWVANHLAETVGWVEGTLTADTWDMHPEGEEPYQSPALTSQKEILALFDENYEAARRQIEATSDEEFAKSWSLLSGGEAMITMPKMDVMRTWVLNHTIHHRAHLCVYLRLNDIAVPGMYGPSADDPPS